MLFLFFGGECVEIVKKQIDSLIPADYNPRKDLTPSDPEYQRLKRSVEEFGYVEPVIYNKRSGVVVGGHQRLKVLKELGFKEIDCVEIDIDETQEKALNIALNKISGSWDDVKLKELLTELTDLDYDVELTGFTVSELESLEVIVPPKPKDIVEDDYDPLQEVPKRVARGEIWVLGEHRLMCGDSTCKDDVEKLMNGEKADMVFTDPPYGMNLNTDYSGMSGNGRKGKTYSKVIGDNDDFKDELITCIFKFFDCKEIFLWGVDYYFDLIPNFKDGTLTVWDKTLQTNGDAGYNSEFELMWSKTPHKKEVIHFNWFRYFGLSSQDIKTRVHPTQKPLQVIQPYIEKYSNENQIVADVYGGSGSTLIACEQLGRKCRMMELDEHYCDVIINRWEVLTGKKAEKVC